MNKEFNIDDLIIIKKNGTKVQWNPEKIKVATQKSATRILVTLTDQEKNEIINQTINKIKELGKDEVSIYEIHSAVEYALDVVNPAVAKSYKDFRNYKNEMAGIMDEVLQKSNSIRYIGDRSNANKDSKLVATKRALIYGELSTKLFEKIFLTDAEKDATRDGYIYIHDKDSRLDTFNCCLFDVGEVLKGGFEMGNMWYNEPGSLDTAFDVLGDIILSTAAQQYGGFTVPEIDSMLEPYAEKSYKKYFNDYINMSKEFSSIMKNNPGEYEDSVLYDKADEYAIKKVQRECEQGMQGIEYKLNTVGSSRGDYPFTTFSFGLTVGQLGKMISKTILNVRKEGQGKKGFKKPVLFPKLVFLYDKELHGEGKICEDVFNTAVDCSSKTMYPDWLSLTGDGYVSEMYKKYKRVVSPMGCVDGKEVITYKYNDILYVESFERMWNRITNDIKDRGQSSPTDVHRVVDLNNHNVYIYDSLKGFVKTKYLIRNLQDNWCDVSISNGRYLRVTTDHPFETNRGVVLAKDLTSNDTIAINTHQYSEETIDERKRAWLLGFMLCDGCYQNYSVFASINSTGEDDIEEAFKNSFSEIFGVMPVSILQERGKKGTYKDLRIYSNGDASLLNNLTSYFTEIYGGVQKRYRHIPNEVFSYSKEAKYDFLAGMIDADGYINDGLGKHKYPTIQIGSTNKELALQQLALAQSLGMQSKIYVNHYSASNKNKIRYRVEFFPNKHLVDAMKCNKKKSKWTDFSINDTNAILDSYVIDVKPLEISQYSYDATTESEHFEVSGVYSHNCRAFLSPYYERGGFEPADENDKPIFVSRFNLGVVTLNLPMILEKAKTEGKDFYEVLDYYLELTRGLHKRTIEYLGNMQASCNPVAFCEGGLYGGHLKPSDKIAPVLEAQTISYGVTALNELQELYNGKSIREDGEFALEVMQYINDYVARIKKEDHILYAVYGTPAESLAGKQIEQFRAKYGVIDKVSSREYVTNSFHDAVWEDINPIEKQDDEKRFWNMFNGGKIQYCRYPIQYNKGAIKTLIRRAMDMGFYEGVNLELSYCNTCGHQELSMNECPVCGSKNITAINRMNGYLGYSRVGTVDGNKDFDSSPEKTSRFNAAKMAEFKDRKSM